MTEHTNFDDLFLDREGSPDPLLEGPEFEDAEFVANNPRGVEVTSLAR